MKKLWMICMAVVLAGCGDEVKTSDASRCHVHDDCNEETPYCSSMSHRCVACLESSDCPNGSCRDGVCVASDVPECLTNDDCSKGSCKDGVCVESDVPECLTNDDCSKGSCKDGVCIESDAPECLETTCSEDGEILLECKDGVQTRILCAHGCAENQCKPECTIDGDCGEDKPFCDEEKCVECIDNSCDESTGNLWMCHHGVRFERPCPNGCADAECLPPKPECASHDDCTGEKPYCDKDGACVACLETACVEKDGQAYLAYCKQGVVFEVPCPDGCEDAKCKVPPPECTSDKECKGEKPFCSEDNVCIACREDACLEKDGKDYLVRCVQGVRFEMPCEFKCGDVEGAIVCKPECEVEENRADGTNPVCAEKNAIMPFCSKDGRCEAKAKECESNADCPGEKKVCDDGLCAEVTDCRLKDKRYHVCSLADLENYRKINTSADELVFHGTLVCDATCQDVSIKNLTRITGEHHAVIMGGNTVLTTSIFKDFETKASDITVDNLTFKRLFSILN